MSDATINELLTRWFAYGDELSYRRAYEHLVDLLYASREAVEVLGNGAVDEIRQDVLSRLLDRQSGKLRDASAPVAYARVAWRRDLATALRKWGPRLPREAEVEDHLRQIASRPVAEEVEARIDADRAVRVAESLPGKGRLAVLLTSRPDRIPDDEWSAFVATLPPPPPPRPHAALEREAASRLLFPPQGPETTAQRYQRLNSFDKAYKRAIASIRAALQVDPS
jgi:hypothetical protein